MKKAKSKVKKIAASSFERYWRAIDAPRKVELAAAVGTSVSYLRQIACGSRPMTVPIGQRVEDAIWSMKHQESIPRPLLGDLCAVCRGCSYFKRGTES